MAGLAFLFQKAIYEDTPQDSLNDDYSWTTSNLRRYLNQFNGWSGFSESMHDAMVEVERRSIKCSRSAWLKEDEDSYVDTTDKLFVLTLLSSMMQRGIGQGLGENKDECHLGANGLGSAAIQDLKGSWYRRTIDATRGWIVNVGNTEWSAVFASASPFFLALCF